MTEKRVTPEDSLILAELIPALHVSPACPAV